MAKPSDDSTTGGLSPVGSAEAPDDGPRLASKGTNRLPPIPSGYRCAPPPPPLPDYLRPPLPTIPGRPEGWVCRRCTEWWGWHPYRPPTEQELDVPCAECRKVMDAEERAVEVNRLLLARLSAGSGFLALPVPTVSPVPARQQRKTSSGLLSKKEAARLLGVDRATTLEDWLSAGRIKAVDLDGRVRIPRAEVERVINEGFPDVTGPQRLRTRRAPKAATSKPPDSPGAEIRKLKF